MRKIGIAFLVLALTAIVAGPAGALVLLTDTFTYPDGNLAGNGVPAWTTFSGTTDILVVSGVVNGTSGNSDDDSRGFAAQSTTTKTYYCLNLTLPAGQSASTVHTTFAFLMDATTTNFFGRLFLMPSATAGKYQVGIAPGSCNSPCLPASWPGLLNLGQQYRIVVSYDPVAGASELWVDPASQADVNVSSSAFSGTAPLNAAVEKFGFRQGAAPTGYSGTNAWQWQVDNLGVADSFVDACTGAPTPAQSPTWGRIKTLYR
jgi:hypothetical protein